MLVSRQLEHLAHDEELIGRAENVVGSLEAVPALVKDAEVNHRAYLISGREQDLQPFTAATSQLEQRLRELDDAFSDYPQQSRRLSHCRGLVLQYRDYLSRIVRARREQGFDAARQILVATGEIATVSEMRSLVADMTRDAHAIVNARREQRFIEARSVQRLVFLSLFLTAVAGLVVVGQFRGEVRRRRRSEERVRADYSEIDERVRQRTRELTEANDLKDRFLSTVSHELRTPLNAVVGWVQILKTGTLKPSEFTHALDAIDRNTNALVTLINNLLDVSRMMQGRVAISRVPTDVGLVVDDVVTEMRHAIDAKLITLEYRREGDDLWVLGDEPRLRQVVEQLLVNAVKFTPQNGRIIVHLFCNEPYAELQVRDTGQGIEPDALPRLFDPFYQGTSRTMRTGLGLGLAIVREVVALHGGTVVVESEGTGRGAVFTVRLPLTRARLDNATHAQPKHA